MKDVSHKRCEIVDCNTRPSFGLKPKKATHCKKHGEEIGMKDVSHKRCEIVECDTHPKFGLKSKKATHCKKQGFLESLMAEQEAALDSDGEFELDSDQEEFY